MVYHQSQVGPVCLAQSHDTFYQRTLRLRKKQDELDETRFQHIQQYANRMSQVQQEASEDEGCDEVAPEKSVSPCPTLNNTFIKALLRDASLNSPAIQEVAANSQLWVEEVEEEELPVSQRALPHYAHAEFELEDTLPTAQEAFNPYEPKGEFKVVKLPVAQKAFDPYSEPDQHEQPYDHAAAMRDWRALWIDGSMQFEAEDSTDDEEEYEREGDASDVSPGDEFKFPSTPSTVHNYKLAKSEVDELDSYWERAEEETLPEAQHAFDPWSRQDNSFEVEEEDLPMFQQPFDPYNVERSWPLKLGDLGGCDDPSELENEGLVHPTVSKPEDALEENALYDSDEEWDKREQLPRVKIPNLQIFSENEGHSSPLGAFTPYASEFQDDPKEMWNYCDEEQEGEDECYLECFKTQFCDSELEHQRTANFDDICNPSEERRRCYLPDDDFRSIPNLGSEQDDAPLLLKSYSGRPGDEVSPSPPDTPMILENLHSFFEMEKLHERMEELALPAAQEAFDPFNHLDYGWAPLPDEDSAENPPSAAQVATAQNGRLVPPPPPPEAIAAALARRSQLENAAAEEQRPIKCIVQFGYAYGNVQTIGLSEGLDSNVGALKEFVADIRGINACSLRASRAGIELQDWNAVEHLDYVHVTRHHC